MDAPTKPDQLILTVTPAGVFIEATNEAPGATQIDAGNAAAVLLAVCRWLIAASARQGVAQ